MAKIVRRSVEGIIQNDAAKRYLDSHGLGTPGASQEPPRTIARKDPIAESPASSQDRTRQKNTKPALTDAEIRAFAKRVRDHKAEANAKHIDDLLGYRDQVIIALIREDGGIETVYNRSRSTAESEARKIEAEKAPNKAIVLDDRQSNLYIRTVSELRVNELCDKVDSIISAGNIVDYCEFLRDHMKIIQNNGRILAKIVVHITTLARMADAHQLQNLFRIQRPSTLTDGEEIDRLIGRISTAIDEEIEHRSDRARERAEANKKSASRVVGRLSMAILVISVLILSYMAVNWNRIRGYGDIPRPPPIATQESPAPGLSPFPVPTRPRATPTQRPSPEVSKEPSPIASPTPKQGPDPTTVDRQGLDGLSEMIAQDLESESTDSANRIIQHINGLPSGKRNSRLRELWNIKKDSGSWDAAATNI
ncbi:hypothetical protein HY570_03970 [Candidatus Micrarchaeota archaeon]|nr:hypothetical protein [Candidatus Micrarchaeota archaeon]